MMQPLINLAIMMSPVFIMFIAILVVDGLN
jgi:hypothetical protein